MPKLPGSAADLPSDKVTEPDKVEATIFALVKGEPTFFTRKEAFTLASLLIISLEADCNG